VAEVVERGRNVAGHRNSKWATRSGKGAALSNRLTPQAPPRQNEACEQNEIIQHSVIRKPGNAEAYVMRGMPLAKL